MMKTRTIDSETPIVPRAVAEAVLEEASVWLGEPLPSSWAHQLAARSNAIFRHNAAFRRRIAGRGNTGRDHLWAFTRHWLSALIQDHRPDLHSRLPASYRVGRPLPV